MDYRTLSSNIVFQGRVFNVRQDMLESPDGRRFQVDLVEHAGAVAFLPLEEDHSIWFVHQYRHPAGELLLELPAGMLNPGEAFEQAVERECREEVGLAPGHLVRLGETFLAPGYSTELLRYYLAMDLNPAPLPRDADEDLSAVAIPWGQAMDRLRSGGFRDAKTVVGLTYAQMWLESQG